jgi:hypothetical protein
MKSDRNVCLQADDPLHEKRRPGGLRSDALFRGLGEFGIVRVANLTLGIERG